VLNKILLFGYGHHGKFIAQGLVEDGFSVKVIESSESFYQEAMEDGFVDAQKIDVTKDSLIQALNPENYTKLVCVMDDEHLNVFLTLSLRSLFKESYILSISDSIHTTTKLQMAGANKVIDLYEVSANKIHNILNRPIATNLLEDFVLYKHGIGFREIKISLGCVLDGVMSNDLDISIYDVLLVGMIDEELGNHFMFITAGVNHKIDVGDTILCVGEQDKLDAFEQLIKESTINLV